MDERAVLIAYLEKQRGHVRASLEGLDDNAARRAPLPSSWSLLGAVHHLAGGGEGVWVRGGMGGAGGVGGWGPDSGRAARGATPPGGGGFTHPHGRRRR